MTFLDLISAIHPPKRSHHPATIHRSLGVRHRFGIMSWTLGTALPHGVPRVLVRCHSPGFESILWFDTSWHTLSGNTAVGNHRPAATSPISSRGRCDLKLSNVNAHQQLYHHETQTFKTTEWHGCKTRFSMCDSRRSRWNGIDVWPRDEDVGQW